MQDLTRRNLTSLTPAMAEITRDSIPLHDDAAIKALVDDLGLKPLKGAPRTDRPLWQSYFDQFAMRRVWRDRRDVWLMADGNELRRVVILGLKDKGEATALRLECEHYRAANEGLEDVLARVVSDTDREARERHDTFAYCLRNIRQNFEWRDGEVIEGAGRFLPISKLNLPVEDVELLRQVFMRLRPQSVRPEAPLVVNEASCPTCGGGKRKRSVTKSLKTGREMVREYGGAFADDGFTAWVEQCLQTNTDKWSRSKTPLYEHYCRWVRKGGHGGNRRDKAEAKATVLSEVKWGRLMRRRFPAPEAQRRDKHSILYRVTLKRGV